MRVEVRKNDITEARVVDPSRDEPADGEVRVRIDRFGYSANNVTYAAAGDTLGYWKFFPTDDPEWGCVPVWGFADVEVSHHPDVREGERLFGYWPSATAFVIRPDRVSDASLRDATPHRAELPPAYNSYRRVATREREDEDRFMLLFPLYVTSWALADALAAADFHGARRVVVVSASSKTAIGLAFALRGRTRVVALTSPGNVAFVDGLGLYDETVSYDALDALDPDVPTAIVDMSGNADTIGRLHRHLGDAMRQTLDVGLTHWEAPRRSDDRIKERSTFFFAPARIQARTKEWGASEFQRRTDEFMTGAIAQSRDWMRVETLDGLEPLVDLHAAMARNESDPARGFVVDA